MNTSAIETDIPKAENVKLTDDTLSVELNDGRTISVPLEWVSTFGSCHGRGAK